MLVEDETEGREAGRYYGWRNGKGGRVNGVDLCELLSLSFKKSEC